MQKNAKWEVPGPIWAQILNLRRKPCRMHWLSASSVVSEPRSDISENPRTNARNYARMQKLAEFEVPGPIWAQILNLRRKPCRIHWLSASSVVSEPKSGMSQKHWKVKKVNKNIQHLLRRWDGSRLHKAGRPANQPASQPASQQHVPLHYRIILRNNSGNALHYSIPFGFNM